MSKKSVVILFLTDLSICLILLVFIYLIELPSIVEDPQVLFVVETILYLTGLSTLYFGWKLIDHKIPSKKDRDEH